MDRQFEEAFLASTCDRAWENYMGVIRDPSRAHWDYVIITASNAGQARGFEAQLRKRREEGFLPKGTHFGVVPDPPGERVGNGGAAFGAMRYVAEISGKHDFKDISILVILSSGDSKRVPQYSALGKVFSPVPRLLPNGRASTLFDEMMINTSLIPGNLTQGMLLLSGDVLLVFDASKIYNWNYDAIAVSFPEPAATGADHGVFLKGKDGLIAKVWHKQKPETLKSYGAIDDDGNVNIDTGAVFFSPDVVSRLFKLISDDSGVCSDASFRRYVNARIAPSLYVDFFYPLAVDSTFEGYLAEVPEGVMCEELLSARSAFWEALRPFRIKLEILSPARFIHFGTTKDVLTLMSTGIGEYGYLGWDRQVASGTANINVAAYNSVVEPGAACGNNVYIEESRIHASARIGSNCILSYVEIEDEIVPSNVVLNCLRQSNGNYITRIYGVEDNPKLTLENDATLFGKDLAAILSHNDIPQSDIWDKAALHNLWTAKLYPECHTIRESVKAALNLFNVAYGVGDTLIWLTSYRKSLQDSFNEADSALV